MVMEILVYFQVFLFGWVSCHFYMAWKLRQALKKVAEDNGMSLDELANTFLETRGIETVSLPNYFTEANGSSILLYNKDTGDFIGQASTVDELAENLYKYDRVKVAVVNHDNKNYWFVEGKVQNEIQQDLK
jgi:hypothetical protein